VAPELAAFSAPAEVLAQAADALAWPLLVLQDQGHLIHANLAARQMLRLGEVLRLGDHQQVQPALPRQRLAFNRALGAALAGERTVLHWPSSGGGAHALTLTLVPLGCEQAGSGPGRLVLLALAASGRSGDVQAYAALHRLSRAETRVLQRLMAGDNSTTAAAALGSAPATVRSQIIALRRKTGHASIGALIQSVARLPPLDLPGAPAFGRDITR
jgi:DNA-binding CsgD family transcriptional regulator